MSLHTNLKGRLRNTSLPKSHGLMPVFEAVVNSIQSIEEKASPTTSGKITLEIVRSAQSNLDIGEKVDGDIVGFTIKDNGCGFDDENFASFETLDSDHKISKGCRGVGRLLWLKTFDKVEVSSSFLDEKATRRKRTFIFDDTQGVHDINITDEPNKSDTGTNIQLKGFDLTYQKAVPKTVETIATALLEHCLWYFVRSNGCPEILVIDGENRIRLEDLYDEHMHKSAYPEVIKLNDYDFELTHIKFRASATKKHQLALCAASRLVKEENIQGKIPGLYNKLSDETGEFIYTCYISSPFLDEHVRAERTSFDLAENVDGLFSDSEISIKNIRDAVLKRAAEYLKDDLSEKVTAGKQRVDDFIASTAPRYRPILNYIDKNELIVDPDISDKDLELHLHSHWAKVEKELLVEGHNIMQPTNDEHTEEYEERLQSYLQKSEDLKKSDLANYVSHRKVIIDLLQKSIERLDNGKYAREDLIHELIMPMRKDSTDVFLDSCNLWLIDERLAFHNYLASDKTLNAMPITDSSSTKEPDLLSLRIFDNPLLVNDQSSLPLGSITVIEIKRPMRNDMKEGVDKDPIDQALDYLDRVRGGKVKTASGRLIPSAPAIPGYCYVLCDLTESMIKRCKSANLTVTADGMGYFGYNDNFKAYIEVISFDQLANAARERNRAFFDKLGLPSN